MCNSEITSTRPHGGKGKQRKIRGYSRARRSACMMQQSHYRDLVTFVTASAHPVQPVPPVHHHLASRFHPQGLSLQSSAACGTRPPGPLYLPVLLSCVCVSVLGGGTQSSLTRLAGSPPHRPCCYNLRSLHQTQPRPTGEGHSGVESDYFFLPTG